MYTNIHYTESNLNLIYNTMKPTNFETAMGIISNFHSNTVIINKVTNGKVPKDPTIHITSCVPACINALKDNNFNLAMKDGFLEVDDIFVKL